MTNFTQASNEKGLPIVALGKKKLIVLYAPFEPEKIDNMNKQIIHEDYKE